MKTLEFTYEMQFRFADWIRDHHYTLKCIPQSNECQKVITHQCIINPSGIFAEGLDGFCNKTVFGYISEEHNSFSIQVMGRVQTGLADRKKIEQPERLGSFLVQSDYTRPGEQLWSLWMMIKEAMQKQALLDRSLEQAIYIMMELEQHFSYRQGITGVQTGAEQAFKLGGGVCQDWCHIMLGLCRNAGIPCRYIVGMLLGEGASHAWIEIADHGFWYALDPTNHKRVTDEHIQISCGRDYHDCIVNKGIFLGAPGQEQRICVTVSEC